MRNRQFLKSHFKNRRACFVLHIRNEWTTTPAPRARKKGLLAAPEAAGCERVYRERVSGGCRDRLEWHRLLDQFRKVDGLDVWKLGHLSRSLRDRPPSTPDAQLPRH